MHEFIDDDAGYLAWLTDHPAAFVLNVRRLPDPGYVVLHRSSCGSITSLKRLPGGYTSRGYRKLCADSIVELEEAAFREGRRDRSFSKVCRLCSPISGVRATVAN